MPFKLPEKVASLVDQAVTLNLADVTSLRCRWPSVRDVTWASAKAEQRSTGNASSNNLYASHLIAASLIGMGGQPLVELVDDSELKALFEKDAAQLTDDEHAAMSEAKFKHIIAQLPGDLIVIAYNVDMVPWLNKHNGMVQKSSSEEAHIKKIMAALELLDKHQHGN